MKRFALWIFFAAVAFGNVPPLPLTVDERFYLFRTETKEKEAYLREPGIILILEPDGLHIGAKLLPKGQLNAYLDQLLKEKKMDRIHLFIREDSRYGDVIHAADLLRKTKAKHIGLFLDELPAGVTYE